MEHMKLKQQLLSIQFDSSRSAVKNKYETQWQIKDEMIMSKNDNPV